METSKLLVCVFATVVILGSGCHGRETSGRNVERGGTPTVSPLAGPCEQAGFHTAIVRTPRAPATTTEVATTTTQRCIDESWSTALRDCIFTTRDPAHIDACHASNGQLDESAARRHALNDIDCRRAAHAWLFVHPDTPQILEKATETLWSSACRERVLPAANAHCLLAALGEDQLRACVDRIPAKLQQTITGRAPSSSECAQAADAIAEHSLDRGPMPHELFASNVKKSCIESWTALEAYCGHDVNAIRNGRDCGRNAAATLASQKALWKNQ